MIDIKTKTTLQFIVDKSTSIVDLKWKLGKYIKDGDLSFLGHTIKELNERIHLAESMDKVNSSDIILSITTSTCETAEKLNIKKTNREDNL